MKKAYYYVLVNRSDNQLIFNDGGTVKMYWLKKRAYEELDMWPGCIIVKIPDKV